MNLNMTSFFNLKEEQVKVVHEVLDSKENDLLDFKMLDVTYNINIYYKEKHEQFICTCFMYDEITYYNVLEHLRELINESVFQEFSYQDYISQCDTFVPGYGKVERGFMPNYYMGKPELIHPEGINYENVREKRILKALRVETRLKNIFEDDILYFCNLINEEFNNEVKKADISSLSLSVCILFQKL